jgi:cytochrome b561
VKPSRHHPLLRVLHGAIAALVIAALFLGTFVMARLLNSDPGKVFLLLKHMLAGALVLALTLLRLFIRPRTRRPASAPSGIAWADRLLMPLVHRIFDALILLMIASGVGIALASGLPEIVFLGHGSLPDSFNALPMHTLHVLTARALAAFIALHLAGALYHQFVLRDGLLSRMSLRAIRRARGST